MRRSFLVLEFTGDDEEKTTISFRIVRPGSVYYVNGLDKIIISVSISPLENSIIKKLQYYFRDGVLGKFDMIEDNVFIAEFPDNNYTYVTVIIDDCSKEGYNIIGKKVIPLFVG